MLHGVGGSVSVAVARNSPLGGPDLLFSSPEERLAEAV